MSEEINIPGKSKHFHKDWEDLQKALGRYLEVLNTDAWYGEMHVECENIKCHLDKIDRFSFLVRTGEIKE